MEPHGTPRGAGAPNLHLRGAMLIAIPLLISALQAAPVAERPSVEEVDRVARRRLASAARGDPDVAEVQAAAARCADPAATDRAAVARARRAALLPRVTAELRFDDRSYRVVGHQSSGDVDYAREAPGFTASLQATWDLAALASPPVERLTARGLLERARRRDAALRSATTLYYERRRLRLALELEPPDDPAIRAAAALEIERLGAELDALTCGSFTAASR
jgi:hypothetical protein